MCVLIFQYWPQHSCSETPLTVISIRTWFLFIDLLIFICIIILLSSCLAVNSFTNESMNTFFLHLTAQYLTIHERKRTQKKNMFMFFFWFLVRPTSATQWYSFQNKSICYIESSNDTKAVSISIPNLSKRRFV